MSDWLEVKPENEEAFLEWFDNNVKADTKYLVLKMLNAGATEQEIVEQAMPKLVQFYASERTKWIMRFRQTTVH
jgi:hypothetical protein